MIVYGKLGTELYPCGRLGCPGHVILWGVVAGTTPTRAALPTPTAGEEGVAREQSRLHGAASGPERVVLHQLQGNLISNH